MNTRLMILTPLVICFFLTAFGCGGTESDKFFDLVGDKDVAGAKEMIAQNPKLVKIVGGYNTTALNMAIETESAEMVRALVDAGSDLENDAQLWGLPLQRAASLGEVEIVKILLDAGADIENQPEAGWASHSNGTALHHATRAAEVDIVNLLLERGADANAPTLKKKSHLSPLHLAVTHGLKEENRILICKALLKHGANVNAKNRRGRTPLDSAFLHKEQHGNSDRVIKLLEANGAKRGVKGNEDQQDEE